jgi:hypothetical protein
MRMVHYFSALAALVLPALLWAAGTGALGSPSHVGVGLFAAVFAALAHSLLILFMIVTGRVLREAMRARPLGPEFLSELNAFFERKAAYPAALFGVLAVVAAAVLGYAHRGFGIPPWVHWCAGILALVFNVWAIAVEHRALRDNQVLVDRVAAELDRIDRERAEDPAAPPPADEPRPDAAAVGRFGAVLAVGAWLPYLYWGLIVWKGRFERVPVHPWVEASALGLALWWIGRRARAR